MSLPVNILVITYWKFSDALVQTYTLPYLRIIRNVLPAGSEIFLVTLEPEGAGKELKEVESGIQRLSFTLHPFGIKAMLGWRKNISFLCAFVQKMNVKSIHTWCTPAGAIGYFVSKRTGIPLVLDSFEPHAEPMVETGTWKKGGLAWRTLHRLEKKQVYRAKWLIGVVAAMRDYALTEYGFTGNNFLFKPACIDLSQFNLLKRKNPELLKAYGLTRDNTVCVYAGKFGGLYMRDEAFRFFRIAHDVFGDKFRILLFTSTSQEEIYAMCRQAGLDPKCVTCHYVLHPEMPEHLGLGDFAFSAFKPVPSRKYCTPIKNGEYWAMGLPVVIGEGISEDSDIIRTQNAGYVLKSITDDEFRNAAMHIRHLLESEDRNKLANRIYQLAEKHRNFGIAKTVYQTIYSGL